MFPRSKCSPSINAVSLVIWLSVLVNPLAHSLQVQHKDAPTSASSGWFRSHKGRRSSRFSRRRRRKPSGEDELKPNILFLMTDSMDGRLVDPKNPVSQAVKMPFLKNFLYKNGATFVNSYTASPLCTPSRTSMFSGRSPESTFISGNSFGFAASPEGVLDDHCVAQIGQIECNRLAKLQKLYDTIPQAMKRLGYEVYLEGKLSIDAGMLNKKSHAGRFKGRAERYSVHWDYDDGEFWRRTGICDQGEEEALWTDAVDENQTLEKKKWSLDTVDDKAANEKMAKADNETLEGCKDFIAKLPDSSKAKRPFFLYCSFEKPHYPFASDSAWIDKYVSEEKIVIPKIDNDMDNYHPFDRFMMCGQGTDVNVTTEMIKKVRRAYYGMAAATSEIMGEIWDGISNKGYNLSNTYVVYVSDHGELAGDHHSLYKQSLYDASTRVPLQIAGPGISKNNRVNHLTSLLDVFPTLLDMAGETHWTKYKRKGQLRGKSLLKLASGSTNAPSYYTLPPGQDKRNCVISQYNWHKASTASFMVRSGKWKYMRFGYSIKGEKNYPPLLFNMDDDPDELKDLSEQEPDVVDLLEAQLKLRMEIGVANHVQDARSFGQAFYHYGSTQKIRKAGAEKFVGHRKEIYHFVKKSRLNFEKFQNKKPKAAGRNWILNPKRSNLAQFNGLDSKYAAKDAKRKAELMMRFHDQLSQDCV